MRLVIYWPHDCNSDELDFADLKRSKQTGLSMNEVEQLKKEIEEIKQIIESKNNQVESKNSHIKRLEGIISNMKKQSTGI